MFKNYVFSDCFYNFVLLFLLVLASLIRVRLNYSWNARVLFELVPNLYWIGLVQLSSTSTRLFAYEIAAELLSDLIVSKNWHGGFATTCLNSLVSSLPNLHLEHGWVLSILNCSNVKFVVCFFWLCLQFSVLFSCSPMSKCGTEFIEL